VAVGSYRTDSGADRLRISPLQLELARTLLLERSESKMMLPAMAIPLTASLVMTRILSERPFAMREKLQVASRDGRRPPGGVHVTESLGTNWPYSCFSRTTRQFKKGLDWNGVGRAEVADHEVETGIVALFNDLGRNGEIGLRNRAILHHELVASQG
jgi:hypothetical protein